MSKIQTPFVLVLGALLLAGCAGDDTVNPLPPPDAGASDASKDATSSDGASAHDAADARAEIPDANEKDAAADAADAWTADSASSEAGDATASATANDAAPDGD